MISGCLSTWSGLVVQEHDSADGERCFSQLTAAGSHRVRRCARLPCGHHATRNSRPVE